jgi:hypothetical protein
MTSTRRRIDVTNPQSGKGNLRFRGQPFRVPGGSDGEGARVRTVRERVWLRRMRPEKTTDKHGVVIVTNAVTI